MLQYASAFDDEVWEPPEDCSEEPQLPEGASESVLQELPETEAELEDPPEDLPEESPVCQSNTSRVSAHTVLGPYYYFYQGMIVF